MTEPSSRSATPPTTDHPAPRPRRGTALGGAYNEIALDGSDNQLGVVGFNNTVTFRHGDPQVDALGSNNSINKA